MQIDTAHVFDALTNQIKDMALQNAMLTAQVKALEIQLSEFQKVEHTHD